MLNKSEISRSIFIKYPEEYFENKLPIVYSDDYNITACGLEKLHPFDSCKYRKSKIYLF